MNTKTTARSTARPIVIEPIGQMLVGVNRRSAVLCKLNGETVVAFNAGGDGEAVYRELCDACDGTGYRPGYQFIDNGRCWPCQYSGLHGKGRTKEEMDRLFRTRATRLANQRAKVEALVAAAEAAHAVWFAALNPVAREVIRTVLDAVQIDAEQSARNGYLCIIEDAGFPEKIIERAWQAETMILKDVEVAFLVADYHKHIARAAAQAERTFMGNVKDKLEFTAKVVFTKVIDGIYGSTTLIKFEDEQGNVATWFASGIQDVQRDQRYTVKGTVKAQEDSQQYGKQAILTRCKLVPVA